MGGRRSIQEEKEAGHYWLDDWRGSKPIARRKKFQFVGGRRSTHEQQKKRKQDKLDNWWLEEMELVGRGRKGNVSRRTKNNRRTITNHSRITLSNRRRMAGG